MKNFNHTARNRLAEFAGLAYIGRMEFAQDEFRNNFVRWLDEMEITRERAALLLGKSVRSIYCYEAGTTRPPRDTRLLMQAIADGFKPVPWPE